MALGKCIALGNCIALGHEPEASATGSVLERRMFPGKRAQRLATKRPARR